MSYGPIRIALFCMKVTELCRLREVREVMVVCRGSLGKLGSRVHPRVQLAPPSRSSSPSFTDSRV